MLAPGGPTAYKLSKEVGINRMTLRLWLNKYGTLDIRSGGNMSKKKLSAKAKIKLFTEYESIQEESDKGAFLRKHGLHSSDIIEWKVEILEALEGNKKKKKGESQSKLKKENKELQKELKRKDKALAEASALLLLKKKLGDLWKEDKED